MQTHNTLVSRGSLTRSGWLARLGPALVVLAAMVLLAASVVLSSGGDPLALIRIGTQYSIGDPDGTEGYDGQFGYYIALDPNPQTVVPHLDIPAYRYQRILLSVLGRVLSLGNSQALPWVLILICILSQAAGTFAVSELLAGWRINRWYALAYGLWAGLTLSVRLTLPESLAFGFVAVAMLARERGYPVRSWIAFALALFAKEVAILFIAAQLLNDLYHRQWRNLFGLGITALLPYAIFQLWLWQVFGKPGIGAGGAGSTPFELIPYMGLLRIAYYSVPYLLAMLVVFGPAVVLPSAWGIWISIKNWWMGQRNVIVLVLFLNALSVAFLPFSTFRETGAILRLATGLVLAVVLFAARFRMIKILNYSLLWIVLNVFLLKS